MEFVFDIVTKVLELVEDLVGSLSLPLCIRLQTVVHGPLQGLGIRIEARGQLLDLLVYLFRALQRIGLEFFQG